MYVVRGHFRHIPIHNEFNIRDVQPAGGHVRGYEYLSPLTPEFTKVLYAHFLL